jgi:tRNA dimethylallyltransferase
LAKRQITWLRSWNDLTWLDSDNIEQALETMSEAIASD